MKQLNDTQKLFIETLKANPDGLTLAEASANAGTEFKSGSVNALVNNHHLVEVVGTKEILVTTKRKVNVYRLKAQPVEAEGLTEPAKAEQAERPHGVSFLLRVSVCRFRLVKVK